VAQGKEGGKIDADVNVKVDIYNNNLCQSAQKEKKILRRGQYHSAIPLI